MSINFDFSAVIALAADLSAAGEKAQGMAELVVAKSAMDVEGHAKGAAPVDTGALRNSIGADITGLRAEVGPTVNYGIFVEFGTYKMAPQPYMGPAADSVLPSFVAAMTELGGNIL